MTAFLVTSCSSSSAVIERAPITNVIYQYPEKVPHPAVPEIQKFAEDKALDHPYNFKIFQYNTLLLTDYIISLQSTIKYYEQEIDRYSQMTATSKQPAKN